MKVSKDTSIEDLVEKVPQSVIFLREKGIVCVVCGEPVWGSLYDVAKHKGFSDESIDDIVIELNQLQTKN
ncbi:MAG TPA: hypothetical protein P5349_04255 [Tenuifilaceae bacterium]|nr:hypothetical protein [Tenuifilaceae bacterium]